MVFDPNPTLVVVVDEWIIIIETFSFDFSYLFVSAAYSSTAGWLIAIIVAIIILIIILIIVCLVVRNRGAKYAGECSLDFVLL